MDENKNWHRACAALEGFFERYGHWPTRLCFPSYAYNDFREIFQPATLWRFLERFEVVVAKTMFAVESDGGRRFDYGSEGSLKNIYSAARHFDWFPDKHQSHLSIDPKVETLNETERLDLILAGRIIRFLKPREVVREVVRFLLVERQLTFESINDCARTVLLEPCRPNASLADALSDPWLMRCQGRWVKLDEDRDWSDFRPVLYRFDAKLPFGVVQWRGTAVVQKKDILARLQLQSPTRRRRYEPPSANATAPIPNSYRVAYAPLFAGQCPRSAEELRQLGTVGVNVLVDLRSYEESGHSGGFGDHGSVEHHRYPLEPGAVPARDTVATVLMVINDCLDRGKTVYVHDKGGLGRSSVVLACLLVEWGLTPHEALAQIRQRAGTMPKAGTRSIPETTEQERFVLAWRSC